MRRICGWCRNKLDSFENNAMVDKMPITHGICSDCTINLFSCLGKPLKYLLDKFSAPVLLVSTDVEIVTANNAGLSALGKKAEDVEGKLGGDVIDCKYAKQPGGCGKTIHCKTCTIRNTVEDTLKSGTAHIKVSAYPDLYHITGDERIKFQITTEKVGEFVFLRIDDITGTDQNTKIQAN